MVVLAVVVVVAMMQQKLPLKLLQKLPPMKLLQKPLKKPPQRRLPMTPLARTSRATRKHVFSKRT